VLAFVLHHTGAADAEVTGPAVPEATTEPATSPDPATPPDPASTSDGG